MPVLLSKFRKHYPKIQFVLNQNNSALLTTQLIDGNVDLCLSSTLMTRENLGWISLCSEELFVVVPEAHPLALRKSFHLKEIAHESFITFKLMYGLRLLADQFFETASIRPKITFEGDEIMTVAALVDANLGVALIPHIPGLEHLHIAFIPISSPTCARPLCIAWNKTKYLSPAAKKFQQFVVDSFNNQDDLPLAPYYKGLQSE